VAGSAAEVFAGLGARNQEADLTGRYLSDESSIPRKWQFPAGKKIRAEGAQFFFTGTDANLNAILDSVIFDLQQTDRSNGRSSADAGVWMIMNPTPGLAK
jgi:hypothetical protein